VGSFFETQLKKDFFLIYFLNFIFAQHSAYTAVATVAAHIDSKLVADNWP